MARQIFLSVVFSNEMSTQTEQRKKEESYREELVSDAKKILGEREEFFKQKEQFLKVREQAVKSDEDRIKREEYRILLDHVRFLFEEKETSLVYNIEPLIKLYSSNAFGLSPREAVERLAEELLEHKEWCREKIKDLEESDDCEEEVFECIRKFYTEISSFTIQARLLLRKNKGDFVCAKLTNRALQIATALALLRLQEIPNIIPFEVLYERETVNSNKVLKHGKVLAKQQTNTSLG